jgi:hypothetical protein
MIFIKQDNKINKMLLKTQCLREDTRIYWSKYKEKIIKRKKRNLKLLKKSV